MLRIPRILTLSSLAGAGPRVVLASIRAKAIGILDLSDVERSGWRHVGPTVGELAQRCGGRPFGLRVREEQLPHLLALGGGPHPQVVMLAGSDESDWSRARSGLSGRGLALIAEIPSRKAGEAAVAAGWDALVVAGNEVGGRGGTESTFILLQAALETFGDRCRIWARGGLGPRAAAGCVAAGAEGVILDGALLLARESALPTAVRRTIESWDGTETTVYADDTGRPFRGYLDSRWRDIGARSDAVGGAPAFIAGVEAAIAWDAGCLWPVGQDAALAAPLARRFVTVAGIVEHVTNTIEAALSAARVAPPLAEGSALARSHGTRYPIVQGPMTRVSDRADFAVEVARHGALPIVALAMMGATEVRDLLKQCHEKLPIHPWGVGLLGFLQAELRNEQIQAVLESAPRFAIIAGGRPDQARALEDAGISTYLHVPSPRLLEQFLREGARRFVLEGRECGGHVGPRSSLLLWEQGIQVVEDAIDRGIHAEEIHLLFAGGVHDERSAAAVAGMSAIIARRGVRVGVLVGTAYLFTEESLSSGAILPGFQREALNCRGTTLLESGPGHLVRVSPTPATDQFASLRARMLAEGRPPEEVRAALESFNVGRLRMAAKGRVRSSSLVNDLADMDPETQRREGLYMMGEVATLRDRPISMAELHAAIAGGSSERLERLGATQSRTMRQPRRRPRPSDVALIGMSAIVPGAGDVGGFWQNTLRSRDSIGEVPPDRWDASLYYSTDPKAPDKIISRWGGFVPDIPFDPLRYGMPPTSLASIEPLHLLTLEAVRAALNDAGYAHRSFSKERTAVVLGAGGGAAQLAMGYAFRSYLPLLDTISPGLGTSVMERVKPLLPEWTEDSFPGILLNVAAGRVANRFDLGGANYTVDAACGSSLAAASLAVRELESGAADLVVLGGADTVQNPFTYLAFSKTHAFSPRGRCRPFDESADGIVISEAVVVVILKRLSDAERDGDRIYAVLKGLGASSDGRAKGLTAPRFEGQVRALERAYEKANVSPSTIGYVEAHGTGTVAGDLAEVQALTQVFAREGAEPGACGLGSVKSLIGHTKCAAGMAGLVNAALALHHRVYPPTIGVERPSEEGRFGQGPFHLSQRARPWLRRDPSLPRRAGVSAFGFGGTNFHAVLEAYENVGPASESPLTDWPTELFVWEAAGLDALSEQLSELEQALSRPNSTTICDLANELANRAERVRRSSTGSERTCRLAIVAADLGDLAGKIARVLMHLRKGGGVLHDPTGIDLGEPATDLGMVAALFPGQGSQYPSMFEELAVALPSLIDTVEQADRTLTRRGRPTVGPLIWPSRPMDDDEAGRQRDALAATDIAQPALGAISTGLFRLLESLGIQPSHLAGHSYGELVALHASGALGFDDLIALSEARGRFLVAACGPDPGGMVALATDPSTADILIDGAEGAVIANRNGPRQTVIAGSTEALQQVIAAAQVRGIRSNRLSVACAFHSPLVAEARGPITRFASSLTWQLADRQVVSNLDRARYPEDGPSIARRIGEHAVSPIDFEGTLETLYAAGVRTFIEVGPGHVLTSLVGSILRDRPHLAVAVDPPSRRGLAGCLGALGRLYVQGLSVRVSRLTSERAKHAVSWSQGALLTDAPTPSATTWLVNGTRVRPIHGPEPARLGPAQILEDTNEVRTSIPARHILSHGSLNKLELPRLEVDQEAPSDRVFLAFQESMRRFLELQRDTMLQWLGDENSSNLRSAATRPSQGQSDPPASTERPSVGGSSAVRETQPHTAPQASAEHLLAELIRERTGYPLEMLQPSMDLEADLGIDSIKRVEILGSLRDRQPSCFAGRETELMERLARARTLGDLSRILQNGKILPLTAIESVQVQPLTTSPGEMSNKVELARADYGVHPKRFVIEPVDAPLAHGSASLPEGGLVLLTDDSRGIVAGLAERLLRRRLRPIIWRNGRGTSAGSISNVTEVDFHSSASIAEALQAVRRVGRVAAFVHALPLDETPGSVLDSNSWSERFERETLSLFSIVQGLRDDLQHAARNRGAAVLAITGMGGGFGGLVPRPDGWFPGQGGIAGFIKTLAREWPEVSSRVVDLDPSEPTQDLIEKIWAELFHVDSQPEVGHHGGRRVSLESVECPLDDAVNSGIELRPGDPVLLTGGARGITAQVALDLARRWKPTLLLIGSSPEPSAIESPATRDVFDASEVKRLLLRNLQRQVSNPGPADLERAFRGLQREREIRSTLARLSSEGVKVRYAQSDVRDLAPLRRIVGRWRSEFGPIAGLVHGAGVIQDKLLADKTAASVQKVITTKLDGALNLVRLLDQEPPRFCVFFSSIAGRFGNIGQSDYAAANDALNKLALWLDERWAGRVVSINWGPWADVGMVSDLADHLARRGLDMIAPSKGAACVARELIHGRKGEVEVMIAGALGNLAPMARSVVTR